MRLQTLTKMIQLSTWIIVCELIITDLIKHCISSDTTQAECDNKCAHMASKELCDGPD